MAEFLTRLNAIDADEIKRVAWKYLHDRVSSCVYNGRCYAAPLDAKPPIATNEV